MMDYAVHTMLLSGSGPNDPVTPHHSRRPIPAPQTALTPVPETDSAGMELKPQLSERLCEEHSAAGEDVTLAGTKGLPSDLVH